MGVRRTGMDYDFVIVGSGFGGSVSALRLAEKGYKVAVVEQGQWVTPADMEQGKQGKDLLRAGFAAKRRISYNP
jgi:choline dehydrogenase-like flavoprotein